MALVTFNYDQDDLNTDGSAKTYWYRISENDTAVASVTKDNTVYYAKVVISNSEAGDGNIDSTVTYYTDINGEALKTEDGTPITGVTFTNTYKATGRAEISGTKELTGNRKTSIGKDEFAFEVVNTESGAVVGTAVLNGGNYSEDFTITFNKDVANGNVVSFTQDDIGNTYDYVLREVIPAEGEDGYNASIDYDETNYPLTVTVVDGDAKGELKITVARGGWTDRDASVYQQVSGDRHRIHFRNQGTYRKPSEYRRGKCR